MGRWYITDDISMKEVKKLIEEYIEEIKKVYPEPEYDETVWDYFRKETSAVVKLSNGMYLPLEKSRIVTTFLVSDKIKDAIHLCEEIKTSEQAFINANTRAMRDSIKSLEGDLCCLKREYPDKSMEFNIAELLSLREGSCHDSEEIALSSEDRKLIIEAKKRELEKFTKRLKTYLKRYGLSKVSARTYRADR